MSRLSRASLATFCLALPLVTATRVAAQLPAVQLQPVGPELSRPVAITHAGDDRLFVTLQGGRVVILERGLLRSEPFLDIEDRVSCCGEQGLLSVAFHPLYSQNGFFFADYTGAGGETVISRFSVSPADANRALATSEKVLLRIPQPFANHNGGQLQFGPDGYLYVGMGDGGSGFDPQCRAQDDSSLLGKLLRLDVDQSPDAPPYHGIPATNPFRGAGAPLDEIWAKGLRNPWRFSFDRQSGDLYLGDVGQNSQEEIDRQPAGSAGGENYGWKLLEGDLCLGSAAGCGFPVPACGSSGYNSPILTYGHQSGRCAVTGGYVYRGSRLPALAGAYLFGDYCTGEVWAARQNGGAWVRELLSAAPAELTTFGEDAAGELYLAAGNRVYRVAAPLPTHCTAGPNTLCLLGGRFLVEASWRTAGGASGQGTAVPITSDAGYFTFFNPNNPELFVKVIDACAPPFDRYWVFVAGLTDVEVSLHVVDVEAGADQTYSSPLGQAFRPVQDTQAFATCP